MTASWPNMSEPAVGPPITRTQIIERAWSWLRPPVRYSQKSFHENEYGIYRMDCSGYVSMAWALPGCPQDRNGGLDTIGLAAVSRVVDKPALQAGDALIRTDGTSLTRHVALFESWHEEGDDAYWGFEQAGGRGTVRRRIDFPYDGGAAPYRAYRYAGVVET
jgi:hypothetical protein